MGNWLPGRTAMPQSRAMSLDLHCTHLTGVTFDLAPLKSDKATDPSTGPEASKTANRQLTVSC